MSEPILLNTFSVLKIETKYYYWENYYNAFFCYDSDSNRNELLFREEGNGTKYSVCVRHGQYILLIPFNSNRMCLYHFVTGEREYISLENEGLFCDAFVTEDCVLLWRWGKGEITKYCPIERNFRKVENMRNVNVVSNGCMVGDVLYGYDGDKKRLYSYNFSDEILKYIDVRLDMDISSIAYNEGELWCVGNKKMILKYSMTEGRVTEIQMPSIICKDDYWSEDLFRNIFCVGCKLYLSPYKANELVSIDIEHGNVSFALEIADDELGGTLIGIDDKVLFIVSDLSMGFAKRQYLISENEIEERKILFLDNNKPLILSQAITLESEKYSINDFIGIVIDEK